MPEHLVEAKEKLGRKIERNQQQLVRLIHTLDSFTEERLVDELERESVDGELAMDMQRSLRDYLKELVAVGVLRYRRGSYSVR
jgi:uncharacterized protein YjgD (DUF1641 family)